MATLITLVSFYAADGYAPYSGLVADAAGDLFGTTSLGETTSPGAIVGHGLVFEIVKTGAGSKRADGSGQFQRRERR